MHTIGEGKCEHDKIVFAWKCLRSVWAVTTSTVFVCLKKKKNYTVLHVLVMWERRLNSSSMILPRCRCSWTCSMWLSSRLRLRTSGRSWCLCLVASSILFVFAGCKIIAFLSHRSDTSFMLFCSSFWTVAVFLSDAFSDVSSANISQCTASLVICRGRSLMKIQRRVENRTLGDSVTNNALCRVFTVYVNNLWSHF